VIAEAITRLVSSLSVIHTSNYYRQPHNRFRVLTIQRSPLPEENATSVDTPLPQPRREAG